MKIKELQLQCLICGNQFTGISTKKYCSSKCCNAGRRSNYSKNKEHVMKLKTTWRNKNKEHLINYHSEYRKMHAKHIKELIRAWQSKHKDTQKIKKTNYAIDNRESINKRVRNWVKQNSSSLTDWYIRKLLYNRGAPKKAITSQIIEQKRMQLTLNRLINEKQRQIKSR